VKKIATRKIVGGTIHPSFFLLLLHMNTQIH